MDSGPQWKDETSYSRSDTDRMPRTWALTLPNLRIIVTRHIAMKGTWFLVCDPASFNLRDLRTDDVSQAKVAALRLVSDRLAKIADYARHAREWQEKSS